MLLPVLLMTFASHADAAAPPQVELACRPTEQGKLKNCKVVSNGCSRASLGQRAVYMAQRQRIRREDYPGDEAVQVIVTCEDLEAAGTAVSPPPAPRSSTMPGRGSRGGCSRGPNGIGLPC